jgi:signal transduction histidine kinase
MKLRLLHLEDSPLDAELALHTLRRFGFDCTATCVQGQEDFLRELRSNEFDIILSDYTLPTFDGISALALAQQHCPHVPFIFVTGTLGEQLAMETLSQGASDYILKSNLERLASSVHRAMRDVAARREREQSQQQIVKLHEELKKRYEEAQQINRMKDEFLAVLSHELRTPLTAIFGWTRLLQTGKLSPEDSMRAVQVIEKNTRIQTQLVNDLLDISRIVSGRFELNPKPIELGPLVESAMQVVAPFAEAKHVQLHAVLARTPCVIHADADRVQQILWNLLSNAVKFSPRETGRVELRMERLDTHARIHVIDNGKGISADFMPKLFRRFSQADSSSTRAQGGLGIGLAIVKHMVDAHGGTITAESAGVGHGASFTVSFPLIRSAVDGSLVPAEKDQLVSMRLDGLRVLLVEDDTDTREVLTKILRENGANVTAVDSVRSALATINISIPDVVVSDIGMPDEDGYSFVRKLHALEEKHGRQMPAIALTAHARTEDRARALTAGFQLHLTKPVEPAHLVSVVANIGKRKA